MTAGDIALLLILLPVCAFGVVVLCAAYRVIRDG